METALYLPVKRFLEKLGFTVKGEVGGCDLVALSGDDPPIVVEVVEVEVADVVVLNVVVVVMVPNVVAPATLEYSDAVPFLITRTR